MCAYTAPPDFVAGTVVPESDLDTLSQDIVYLLTERTIARSTYVGGANKTTTSATFADADATNLKISITPKSSRVRVTFSFFAGSDAGTIGEFDIYSVGLTARGGDATHGLVGCPINQNGGFQVEYVFSGLTANVAQEFRLQFRSVSAGNTTTIYNNGQPVSMTAEEC